MEKLFIQKFYGIVRNYLRISKSPQKFIDSNKYEKLTPRNDLELDEYMQALDWALNQRRVNNIALTGTYGSGKSSILQSFIVHKAKSFNYFNISLASFNSEVKNESGNTPDELIERSILKQLFYSADGKDLPDSRLKRINSTNLIEVFIHSIWFALWLLSTASIFNHSIFDSLLDWIDPPYDQGKIKVLSIIISFSGLVILLFYIIKRLKKITLSKLNLSPVELEVSKNDKSVFHKHLAEILYFFERKKYDVIVFEDIDRFKSINIFSKLRELNTLLNNSKTIGRSIKFIYAVRDDVFIEDNERTKFFDFIIPIIPIINSSNSDSFLSQKLKSSEVSQNLITGISIYIDDMRILNNVCNEYFIYKRKLSSVDLSQDRLFAIIVYKNLFPKDFAKLQYDQGSIFEIFQKKPLLIQNQRSLIVDQLEVLETELEKSQNEEIDTLERIRKQYISDLTIRFHNQSLTGVIINGTTQNFNDLIKIKKVFDDFKKSTSITLNTSNGPYSTGLSFSDIENGINENISFDQRENSIILKSKNERNLHHQRISTLKKELQEIENKRIVDLINNENKYKVIPEASFGEELLFFLLSHGYITEHYKSYISYFHEGILTQNDQEFILSVIERRSVEDLVINNYREVIERLAIQNFSSEEVLNIDLVNYIISNQNSIDANKLQTLIDQLANESENSILFLTKFIGNKLNELNGLSELLLNKWPNIWSFLDINEATTTIKESFMDFILLFSNKEQIQKINESSQYKLANYISNNADFIKNYEANDKVEEIIDKLRSIKVKFSSLNIYNTNSELLNSIIKFNLYRLNPEMIKLVLKVRSPLFKFTDDEFENSNYSVLLKSDNQLLLSYVDREINQYVDSIILNYSIEINEDEHSLINLLNNENLKSELKSKLIEFQTSRISNIKEVNEGNWEDLLSFSKVDATWKNMMDYYENYSGFLDEPLIQFLNNPMNSKVLSSKMIPLSAEKWKEISTQIISSEDLEDDSVELLVESVPWTFFDFEFDDLSKERVRILVASKTIGLSEIHYDKLKSNFAPLHIQLIQQDLLKFYELKDNLDLEASDFERLLRSQIHPSSKRKILNEIQFEEYPITKNLANILLDLYSKTNLYIGYELLLELFENGIGIEKKIKLLNKHFQQLTTGELINLIIELPENYRNIVKARKSPTISKNSTNEELLKNLKLRGLISSYKQFSKGFRIYKKN